MSEVVAAGRDGLALAAASERLRGKPGRPRASQASAPPAGPVSAGGSAAAVPAVCPARLLDLPATAAYLALSPWTVRDLEAAGALRRVRVPLPGGRELRRLLFDRLDLDRLVDTWKDQ